MSARPASTDWFENDAFWEAAGPFMFTERRMGAAAEQVDQAVGLLGLEPGARVLDLCCGPGRHSLELARRGYAVTGVDRTAGYLEQARAQAREEDLSVEFVREDMRRFHRQEVYDAALSLYTSFGYFADPAEDRQVIENLCCALKPGGSLVMEMMGKEVLARIFRERDWWQEEDGGFFLEERELAEDWSQIRCRWIIVRAGRSREFRLALRLYSAVELTALLQACGFGEVEILGSLAGGPYNQAANRLVAVARKVGGQAHPRDPGGSTP